MYSHRIPAVAVFGSMLLALLPSLSNVQAQAGAGRPRVIEVSSVAPEKNAQLSSLIAEIRSQTDAFVFLSGGASRMREDHQQQLLGMFEALALSRKAVDVSRSGMVARRRGLWKAAGRASGQRRAHYECRRGARKDNVMTRDDLFHGLPIARCSVAGPPATRPAHFRCPARGLRAPLNEKIPPTPCPPCKLGERSKYSANLIRPRRPLVREYSRRTRR